MDWVLIDMEHGASTETVLPTMIMATRGSTATPLARVKVGERIGVGRALDSGAMGVMVPQVHSEDDARAVARWMRTQPAGDRGIALFTRGMDYGAVGHAGVASRHEDLVCIVQIESREGLENVERIAAVEGVDVLFVGPTDLTHAMGIPGQLDDPQYADAIARVAAAADANGKAAGVLLWKPEDVGRYAALGFRMIGLSSDAMILDRAMRVGLDQMRSAAKAATTTEVR
jgi:4-hydroxy-2-oxoheptanedioate aldolase